MLRAIQKFYFPDSPRAASLWIKVYNFAVARERERDFQTGGHSGGLALATEALKNMTARNAEEKYHRCVLCLCVFVCVCVCVCEYDGEECGGEIS